MILAAIAALTMTAQAQFLGWIEVGDYYNTTETYNGSSLTWHPRPSMWPTPVPR